MKPETIDWDIVFALMHCYGMLELRGFPIPKKTTRLLPRSKRATDHDGPEHD